MAEGFKNRMPEYLKSVPPQKNHPSTEFEREVAEVDPFLENDYSLGSKSKESPENYKEFNTLSDKDVEDIFSSTTESSENEEKASLIDRISNQQNEIQVNKDSDEKLILGQRHKEKTKTNEEDPSLISDVFETPEEIEKNLNRSEERFSYKNEKQTDTNFNKIAMEERPDDKQINFNNQERKPSNYNLGNKTGVFKSGMYIFLKNCILYSEPGTSSEPKVIIKSGKELWLDNFNDQWHKAYTKDGPVFLQASCLN